MGTENAEKERFFVVNFKKSAFIRVNPRFPRSIPKVSDG